MGRGKEDHGPGAAGARHWGSFHPTPTRSCACGDGRDHGRSGEFTLFPAVAGHSVRWGRHRGGRASPRVEGFLRHASRAHLDHVAAMDSESGGALHSARVFSETVKRPGGIKNREKVAKPTRDSNNGVRSGCFDNGFFGLFGILGQNQDRKASQIWDSELAFFRSKNIYGVEPTKLQWETISDPTCGFFFWSKHKILCMMPFRYAYMVFIMLTVHSANFLFS